MYELLKKDGKAKRGVFIPYTDDRNAGIYECGDSGRYQGGCVHRRLKTDQDTGRAFNTYHLHVRPGDKIVKKLGRTAPFYELGQADPHRFRRVPGILPASLRKIKERECIPFPC